MEQDKVQEILSFWFGDDPGGGSWRARVASWFSSNDDLDREIQNRFGDLVRKAATGELQSWTESAHGRLALIILLDQFSRNIYRGTAAAFGNDERALTLTLAGIESGSDGELHPIERLFLCMPMMHSEDLAVQSEGLIVFRALAEEPGDAQEMLGKSLDSAVQHYQLIERFGRFPHRNAILGRQSTPAEEAFLADGGPTFGQSAPDKR